MFCSFVLFWHRENLSPLVVCVWMLSFFISESKGLNRFTIVNKVSLVALTSSLMDVCLQYKAMTCTSMVHDDWQCFHMRSREGLPEAAEGHSWGEVAELCQKLDSWAPLHSTLSVQWVWSSYQVTKGSWDKKNAIDVCCWSLGGLVYLWSYAHLSCCAVISPSHCWYCPL